MVNSHWPGTRQSLPTVTSHGVKHTHDHKHSILHSNRGPTRIRLIPTEHPQKKVVGDGGAKHRYIDPPTAWHSVADRHAVATIPQGGPPGLDPTITPIPAYDPISCGEANNFGKKILRMTGIVQMLHVHKPPYDKYLLNAHRTRTLTTQPRTNRVPSGTQARTSASMASAIPGSCRTRSWQFTHH